MNTAVLRFPALVPVLVVLLAVPLLFARPDAAPCAGTEGFSTSPSPPRNGLEPVGEPLKNRKTPVIGSFSDAYGNPITGEMTKKEAKKRLPAGAYGGYKPAERPLPDPKNDAPVW